MADFLPNLVFYLFAAITVISGLLVISCKNPVHSVFFLILAFFNSAGLFVLLGAEYVAMTLVIVYVGAVAVLFLFVVMMLDVNFTELRAGFIKYLPVGVATAVTAFLELFVAFYASLRAPATIVPAIQPIPASATISNTHAIGNVLYTYYFFPFQMAGLVLLVAMVGAIVLTLRSRPGVRKQRISAQLARHPRDGVEIVKVKTGQGVTL